ncbi:hypothetical protein PAXRUDRAFT_791682 [Paxillus rubicundulus Ve08.2h10]|uniref:Unplaced genomic scaffold scaffold_427, whole genome shotgun sequence n=1 Tax=Paxillus rubicundulus Ve08.2h10 TaxID=930991 RepID=A0A0D0DMB9_9AGAM|nr:hypothetical protein PAXRUDRAFT_791682 [Paxillus rubicundulus Ve08.2h10]
MLQPRLTSIANSTFWIHGFSLSNRRPPHPRLHHGEDRPTGSSFRTQGSRWKLWKTTPHLLLGRSSHPPRHAEVTTVYLGFVTNDQSVSMLPSKANCYVGQRIYVVSRDNEHDQNYYRTDANSAKILSLLFDRG